MADLNSLLLRLRMSLGDESSLIWSSARLEESLRQALAAINRAGGQAFTLNGLDGAVVTSLPAEFDFVVLLGATCIALRIRRIDRSEASLTAREVSPLLEESLTCFEDQFQTQLEAVRRQYLQAASQLPYAVPPEPDEGSSF